MITSHFVHLARYLLIQKAGNNNRFKEENVNENNDPGFIKYIEKGVIGLRGKEEEFEEEFLQMSRCIQEKFLLGNDSNFLGRLLWEHVVFSAGNSPHFIRHIFDHFVSSIRPKKSNESGKEARFQFWERVRDSLSLTCLLNLFTDDSSVLYENERSEEEEEDPFPWKRDIKYVLRRINDFLLSTSLVSFSLSLLLLDALQLARRKFCEGSNQEFCHFEEIVKRLLHNDADDAHLLSSPISHDLNQDHIHQNKFKKKVQFQQTRLLRKRFNTRPVLFPPDLCESCSQLTKEEFTRKLLWNVTSFETERECKKRNFKRKRHEKKGLFMVAWERCCSNSTMMYQKRKRPSSEAFETVDSSPSAIIAKIISAIFLVLDESTFDKLSLGINDITFALESIILYDQIFNESVKTALEAKIMVIDALLTGLVDSLIAMSNDDENLLTNLLAGLIIVVWLCEQSFGCISAFHFPGAQVAAVIANLIEVLGWSLPQAVILCKISQVDDALIVSILANGFQCVHRLLSSSKIPEAFKNALFNSLALQLRYPPSSNPKKKNTFGNDFNVKVESDSCISAFDGMKGFHLLDSKLVCPSQFFAVECFTSVLAIYVTEYEGTEMEKKSKIESLIGSLLLKCYSPVVVTSIVHCALLDWACFKMETCGVKNVFSDERLHILIILLQSLEQNNLQLTPLMDSLCATECNMVSLDKSFAEDKENEALVIPLLKFIFSNKRTAALIGIILAIVKEFCMVGGEGKLFGQLHEWISAVMKSTSGMKSELTRALQGLCSYITFHVATSKCTEKFTREIQRVEAILDAAIQALQETSDEMDANRELLEQSLKAAKCQVSFAMKQLSQANGQPAELLQDIVQLEHADRASYLSCFADISDEVSSLARLQDNAEVVSHMKKICSTRGRLFMTYVANFLSFQGQHIVQHDPTLWVRQECLHTIFEHQVTKEHRTHQYKELFLPSPSSIVSLHDNDNSFCQRDSFNVTSRRLSLLFRIDELLESKDLTENLLCPNLIERTMLCIHALKCQSSVITDPVANHIVEVQFNCTVLSAVEKFGIKSLFPPLVTKLFSWYIFQALEEVNGTNNDILRYICCCLEIFTILLKVEKPSSKASEFLVWSMATVFCDPYAFPRLLALFLDPSRGRARCAVYVVLRCSELLCTLTSTGGAILGPALALSSLCSSSLLYGSNLFHCRIVRVLNILKSIYSPLLSAGEKQTWAHQLLTPTHSHLIDSHGENSPNNTLYLIGKQGDENQETCSNIAITIEMTRNKKCLSTMTLTVSKCDGHLLVPKRCGLYPSFKETWSSIQHAILAAARKGGVPCPGMQHGHIVLQIHKDLYLPLLFKSKSHYMVEQVCNVVLAQEEVHSSGFSTMSSKLSILKMISQRTVEENLQPFLWILYLGSLGNMFWSAKKAEPSMRAVEEVIRALVVDLVPDCNDTIDDMQQKGGIGDLLPIVELGMIHICDLYNSVIRNRNGDSLSGSTCATLFECLLNYLRVIDIASSQASVSSAVVFGDLFEELCCLAESFLYIPACDDLTTRSSLAIILRAHMKSVGHSSRSLSCLLGALLSQVRVTRREDSSEGEGSWSGAFLWSPDISSEKNEGNASSSDAIEAPDKLTTPMRRKEHYVKVLPHILQSNSNEDNFFKIFPVDSPEVPNDTYKSTPCHGKWPRLNSALAISKFGIDF